MIASPATFQAAPDGERGPAVIVTSGTLRGAGSPAGSSGLKRATIARVSPIGPDEPDRRAAIRELEAALPPIDRLLAWARENRPPQSWYDEEG